MYLCDLAERTGSGFIYHAHMELVPVLCEAQKIHPATRQGALRALHLCGLAEADGAGLQAVQLIQVAANGEVADEVVHLIVLLRHPGLLGDNGLRRVEAVVHPPDALAVAYRKPCTKVREEIWAGRLSHRAFTAVVLLSGSKGVHIAAEQIWFSTLRVTEIAADGRWRSSSESWRPEPAGYGAQVLLTILPMGYALSGSSVVSWRR